MPASKAMIAQRVIEVLEYFNDDRRVGTVMEIARYYKRPQSSTSDLLTSLVEQGVLQKETASRGLYSLAPRAALLGTAGHSDVLRDGSLVRLARGLVAQERHPVAVFGRTGDQVTILAWENGRGRAPCASKQMGVGLQAPLSDNAAGWLLLSILEEASRPGQYSIAELESRLRHCRAKGVAIGPFGFGSSALLVARRLPPEVCRQPLVAGIVLGEDDPADTTALLGALDDAICKYLTNTFPEDAADHLLADAA